MPQIPISFQETPNPNAVKCVVGCRLGDGVRSYFKPEQASGDALAEALFAIPGVTNLLIQPTWLTVSKSPERSWKDLKPEVERVVRAFASGTP